MILAFLVLVIPSEVEESLTSSQGHSLKNFPHGVRMVLHLLK